MRLALRLVAVFVGVALLVGATPYRVREQRGRSGREGPVSGAGYTPAFFEYLTDYSIATCGTDAGYAPSCGDGEREGACGVNVK